MYMATRLTCVVLPMSRIIRSFGVVMMVMAQLIIH